MISRSKMLDSKLTFLGAALVTLCGGRSNSYCCGPCTCADDQCRCDGVDGPFELKGSLNPYTTVGAIGFAATQSTLTSFSASSTTSSISLSLSTSSTTSSISLPLSTSSSTSASSVESPKSDNAINIGVGVGVPLTALFLSAVVVFFYRRDRRLKKRMQEMQTRLISSTHFSDDSQGRPRKDLSTFNNRYSGNGSFRYNANPHQGILVADDACLEVDSEPSSTPMSELSSQPLR